MSGAAPSNSVFPGQYAHRPIVFRLNNAAGNARLIKRQLFDLAAALSEAPGRHVACQITARVRAAPSEQ
jgi:hypothetical protein